MMNHDQDHRYFKEAITPFLFSFAVFLLSGCTMNATATYDELAGLNVPDIKLMAKIGLTAVHYELMDKTGKRMDASSTRFVIQYAEDPVTIYGDRNGLFKIPIDNKYRGSKAVLSTPYSFTPVFYNFIPFTVSYPQWGEPIQFQNLENLKMRQSEGFTIFYEAGCEEAVQKAQEELSRGRELIQSLCDVMPISFAIAIVKEPGNYYTLIFDHAFPVWTLSADDVLCSARNLVISAMIHEWTELSLHKVFNKYGWEDPRVRFAFDGIAEYVRFKAYPQSTGSRLWQIQKTIDKEIHVTDFYRFAWGEETISNEEITRDYGVAMCFWIDLAERYGPAVIPAFLKQWSQAEKRNWESAVSALNQVTQSDQMEQQLRRMDLQSCADLLKKHGVVPTQAPRGTYFFFGVIPK